LEFRELGVVDVDSTTPVAFSMRCVNWESRCHCWHQAFAVVHVLEVHEGVLGLAIAGVSSWAII
jgi:hypothetical protein